jgi:hypothetical protein
LHSNAQYTESAQSGQAHGSLKSHSPSVLGTQAHDSAVMQSLQSQLSPDSQIPLGVPMQFFALSAHSGSLKQSPHPQPSLCGSQTLSSTQLEMQSMLWSQSEQTQASSMPKKHKPSAMQP